MSRSLPGPEPTIVQMVDFMKVSSVRAWCKEKERVLTDPVKVVNFQLWIQKVLFKQFG